MANGIVFSGVQDPDVDPAFALLSEELRSTEIPLRIAATFGLGLAYANSKREQVIRKDDGVVEELRKVESQVKKRSKIYKLIFHRFSLT